MQPSRPLLTIAIPTYNRATFLSELLASLEPQIAANCLIELIISDNASTDDTFHVVARFKERGLVVLYVRNPVNIGSDANFAECFELAKGKHFLLFGDDDLLVPGAIAKIIGLLQTYAPDIMYLASYSFVSSPTAERKEDPLNRKYQIIRAPLHFARVANLMLTFISGIVVNRDRLMEIDHEPVASFVGTNLVQLSWILPLLRDHRMSICVWERLLAARVGNSGGYNIAQIFGINLKHVAERLLPAETRIAQSFPNAALRRWFPGAIVELRSAGAGGSEIAKIASLLREEHEHNVRRYMFVCPVLNTPLPFAKFWVILTRMINKLIYAIYEFPMRMVSRS